MAVTLLFGGFTTHPKILRAGESAGWLLVKMLEYTNEHGTDGYIADYVLDGFGLRNTRQRLEKLALQDSRHGALVERVEGGWQIHDFLEWNQPAVALDDAARAKSEKRAAAGRKGADVRWGRGRRLNGAVSPSSGEPPGDSNAHGKPDSNAHGKPIANGMANEWQTDSSSPSPSPVVSSSLLDGPQLADAGVETPDHLEGEKQEQLAVAVHRLQPTWQLGRIRTAVRLARERAGFVRVTAAMLIVAAADDSKSPRRVLADGYWWDESDTRYSEALMSSRLNAALSDADLGIA